MKKVLLSLTVASLLVTSLQARGGHHGGFKPSMEATSSVEMKMPRHGHGLIKYLFQLSDLTTDQTDTIFTAFSDERESMRTLYEEKRVSGTLLNIISESGLDREAFLIQEAEFHSKIAELKANTLETILATLTPEQILELKSLIEAEVTLVDETEESDTTAE